MQLKTYLIVKLQVQILHKKKANCLQKSYKLTQFYMKKIFI